MKQLVFAMVCVLGLFVSAEVLAKPALLCPEEQGGGGDIPSTEKAKTDWTMEQLNKTYSSTAHNLGLVFKNGDGKYEKYKGSDDLFNKYGFYGLCLLDTHPDCKAVNAYWNMKAFFTHIADPVLKADKAIIAGLAFKEYAKSLPTYMCKGETCYKIDKGVKTPAPDVTPDMLPTMFPTVEKWLAEHKEYL